MGKLRHAAGPGPLSVPALAVTLALAAMAPAQAEIRFTPTASVTETYTDNVALARDDLAQSAFVSELTPGFTLSEHTRRLTLTANYQLHTYAYSGQRADNTNRAASDLSANLRSILIDDLLFLDATASVGQQQVSPFGQQIANNNYSSANRATLRTYSVSPYLVHAFGAFATSTLRYTHNSVSAGGTSGLGSSVGDSLSASLNSGSAFKRIGWGVQYQRQQLDDGINASTSSQSFSLLGSYALSTTLRMTASAGAERYDYATVPGVPTIGAPNNSGHSWSAGFAWTPSARTSLQATYGRRYFGTTSSLAAAHHSRHTLWNISYNEDVTTNRASYLLQSSVSTAAMLDGLFAPSIPDATARAQAVQAYILANGLPASVANNTNYFSNRFQLQKQFQASVGLTASRSTLLFSASQAKRTALSSVQADSDLLGGFNSAINDNTVLRTVSLTGSYQLSPRSTLSASASASHNESLSVGVADHSKNLRLSMSRQFLTKLRANVELRRVEGTLGFGNSGAAATPNGSGVYHENAISATLSMQL